MAKPRYLQISDDLRQRIVEGEFQYGERFPTERELENALGADRKTIRKSLTILTDEGLLVRLKGKGTFVKKQDIDYSMRSVSGLGSLLEQQGIKSATKVLSLSREPAGYRLSKAMRISRADTVCKIVRLRLADGEPVALETSFIPEKCITNFDSIDFEVYSIYDVLQEMGHVPTAFHEEIDAAVVSGVEAKYLGMDEGEAAFLVRCVTEDQDGEVIEVYRAYTNSDRIRLSTDLS